MNPVYRNHLDTTDPATVRAIVESSGFFNPEEINVAVELVAEACQRGTDASGYRFLFQEQDGRTVGYSCFGRIAGTRESFDLYWIAVHNDYRGCGLGRQLLDQTETAIAALGGKRIYIETSSRDLYRPTQKFYTSAQYVLEAVLKDFYAPGDSKLIYVKALPGD